MSELFDLLEAVSGELPGCRLTSIVSEETGMPLASVAAGDPLDSAGADAYHSDLYRLINQAMASMDSGQRARGLVITGKAAVFISLPLGQSGYLWHVATDRNTTLGFTHALMRKYLTAVQENVLKLVAPPVTV